MLSMFVQQRRQDSRARQGQAQEDHDLPRTYDVLCGKDKTYNKHAGNRVFRETIVAHQDAYAASQTKQNKMQITKNIVSSMQDQYGTRFVKLSAETGQWEEISNQVARDKVSHALRFAAKHNAGSDKKQTSSKSNNKSSRRNSTMSSVPTRLRKLVMSSARSKMSSSMTTTSTAAMSSSWTSASSSVTSATAHASDNDSMTLSDREEQGMLEEEVAQTLFRQQQAILSSTWSCHFNAIRRPTTATSYEHQYQQQYHYEAQQHDDDRSNMIVSVPSSHELYAEQPQKQQGFGPSSNGDEQEDAFDTLRTEDLDAIMNEPFLSLREARECGGVGGERQAEWNAVMALVQ